MSVPKICQGQQAGEVLDCVYVDLTSPQSVKSASGYLYVMNLIDDKSSAVWCLLLPAKSDTIKQLKIWILMVEWEMGKKIGRFNINNGELKCKEFVELCES